jgi:hypothetical protein
MPFVSLGVYPDFDAYMTQVIDPRDIGIVMNCPFTGQVYQQTAFTPWGSYSPGPPNRPRERG